MNGSMSSDNTVWASRRLVFRGIEPEDDAMFYRMKREPSVHLNVAMALPTPVSKADAKNTREFLSKCYLSVAITLAPEPGTTTDPGTPAPAIGFTCLRLDTRDSHNRCAAVGISIAKEYQGKGYGKETLSWLVEWGFRHANLHRIELEAFGWNEVAIHLYQKLGFVHEGTSRKALWFDGRWWDRINFGMLQEEWNARH